MITVDSQAISRLQTVAGLLWPLLLILAVWQIAVSVTGVSSIVIPAPADVLAEYGQNPRTFGVALGYTLAVAVFGLIVGMLLGVLLASVVWASRLAAGLVTPAAVLVQSVPIIAIVPVLARLLGYDIKTVAAIAVLISFFPTFVLTLSGLAALPPGSADVFRVLGARRWHRYWRLALPAAVPNLLTAFRIAAANAILATLVAEFLMGTQGLGSVIAVSLSSLEVPAAWAASLLAMVLSITAFVLAGLLQRRLATRWR